MPIMEQCPVCQRIFTSSRYLLSHLNQSTCRASLLPTNSTNLDSIPTNSGSISEHPRKDPDLTIVESPNNDPIMRPMSLNAFGDVIVDADDASNDDFAILDETEEMSDQPAIASPPPPHPGILQLDNVNTEPSQEPEQVTNQIFTILEQESFNVPGASDEKLITMLKMIKAVRAVGAPLSLLDTLVKILKEEGQVGRLDITHLCTHKTALRRISKMFPNLPAPISVTITHERTIEEMNSGAPRHSLMFPKFSFLAQLQDLLDDHVFSDLKNLVVDPENRWDFYKRNSCPHSSDEIQDGHWFQDIVQTFEQQSSSSDSIPDFILGFQGYVDKTGTDAHQRTAVEPFVFTLTIFTNRVRNSDSYWRVLALLPASLCQKQRKKHSFGASVRNYHTALRQAFSEVIELQRNPPIVRLRLGNQYRNVRARIFWVNTIADGLANEALTGRVQNRNSSPRLSRGCHCPQHLADDSSLYCKFLRQAAIEHLTMAALGPTIEERSEWDDYLDYLDSSKSRRAAESALKMRKKIASSILHNVFGQHVVDLVWYHIDQGPNPRGCFGSTPVDPMHAFEEGIVPNIMSVILDPLSETAKTTLDALAVQIVACNRWDPDYPRMNFSGGFCSLTQLTADEKVGKMILLWIIMLTPIGREIIEARCNSCFDATRVARAGRFTIGHDLEADDQDDDDGSSIESNKDVPITAGSNRNYIGTPTQIAIVDRCLREYCLEFVLPWIDEMMPFHQDLLRKTVFRIISTRGKSQQHRLPMEPFLDRRPVMGVQQLYVVDEDAVLQEGHPSVKEPNVDARYSIDATCAQLQALIEMLLSFHASYKYASMADKENFNINLRLMMHIIKRRINRGRDTQNWAISKFHELLHMYTDTMNFGSHANFDAGKGEHGLKKWAKLPSKTVRTRDANHYFQDMATRIRENQLVEVASATLLPRNEHTFPDMGEDVVDQQHRDEEENIVTIELSGRVMLLDVVGPSLLPPELTSFLRNKPDLVFPLEIFQEAKFARNGGPKTTIRGTPNYRNSGPWHDCVHVVYEDDRGAKKEYPYQVYGFFRESGKQTQSAVGRLGLQKKETSHLMDQWTYEKNYRVIDLETMSRKVFALTMPASCYRENGGQTPHRMYVFKDRITEWPWIFNHIDWCQKETIENTRKRKTRR